MQSGIRKAIVASGVVLLALTAAGSAQAQLQQSPFAFSTSPGGLGQSFGGREALLNQKLDGSTPVPLLRDERGGLLTIERGPGGNPIVSLPDGRRLPGYRPGDRNRQAEFGFSGGGGFRAGGLSAGSFLALFVPTGGRSGFFDAAQGRSGDIINTWTLRAAAEGSGGYFPASNSVDVWTGMVLSLGGR